MGGAPVFLLTTNPTKRASAAHRSSGMVGARSFSKRSGGRAGNGTVGRWNAALDMATRPWRRALAEASRSGRRGVREGGRWSSRRGDGRSSGMVGARSFSKRSGGWAGALYSFQPRIPRRGHPQPIAPSEWSEREASASAAADGRGTGRWDGGTLPWPWRRGLGDARSLKLRGPGGAGFGKAAGGVADEGRTLQWHGRSAKLQRAQRRNGREMGQGTRGTRGGKPGNPREKGLTPEVEAASCRFVRNRSEGRAVERGTGTRGGQWNEGRRRAMPLSEISSNSAWQKTRPSFHSSLFPRWDMQVAKARRL
jgi:hypothetical protein